MDIMHHQSMRHQGVTNNPSVRIAFALFTEILLLSLFSFLVLLSVELLLPTFITERVNLALSFGSILILFFVHQWFASWLNIRLNTLSRLMQRLLFGTLALWVSILLLISLLKFHWIAIIILFSCLYILAYLFHKTPSMPPV